ncbi:LuxR family two component transcriptional regulator [Lachnotalea glycerini]|uniref:Stage 0 sporulation protein A homolog n=1 Tax=Lachnotalea glycerini TaxID=1763509 RepID=A0A255I9F8_9FIRM|nr:response regulator transcription factor [Lachnotalea glycerini]PXV85969.1 LuxR family two component transcriptional regulator [Lachnotalea glycerini]RDY31403.1 DNA-binding response regulator [Lachnotalea glycerini]
MKIVIVDDDKLVALSLKTILEASQEVEVLALGQNGQEAIDLYYQFQPEVLLMDIRMDFMTGIEAARHILSKYPLARILFLTTFSDDEYVIQALKLGAKGYILKQNFDSILPAIQAVYSGQSVFGNEIVSKIPQFMNNEQGKDFSAYGITAKEFEMIELVAKGLSNKEIAKKLYLSEGTVRNYLSLILDKLDLRDRTQLAVFYYKN